MNGTRRDGTGSCDDCRASFEYMMIHNGFNDTAYGYCDTCGMTTLVGGWGDTEKPPEAPLKIHGPLLPETEAWLESCSCGGRFRHNAAPRCPSCNATLNAETATKYIESNAPGTKKGWGWQRSWTGMYCIVVNGRMTENNWRAKSEVG